MELLPAQEPSFLRPGTKIGEWRVVTRGGRGAYGIVYRVERVGQEGGEPCALKVALHATDERFEREVELLSHLKHPHVPRLKDSGVWTGAGGATFPFFVMEWVEGYRLYEWVARNTFTSRQALRLLAGVARALEATHAVEGVHRDVKGENVLVEPGGRAVLTDFGSGWYRGARRLTRKEEAAGTVQYWSPEALRHRWRYERFDDEMAHYEARPADDVYALGVMAYRMVTGSYPPPCAIMEEVDGGGRARKVEPEAVATVSPELAALIRRMLSHSPAARGGAGELAEALEQAAKKAGSKADRPITRRKPRLPWRERIWRGVRRPEVAWMGWLVAGLGGVVTLWGPERGAQKEQPAEVARAAQEERRDGGPAALGDKALTARVSAERPASARGGVGLELPKEPLPGQRRPPCKKHEIEIHDGCWIAPPNALPPCDEGSYEWKNKCYWPLIAPGRPSTSKQR